MNLLRFFLGCLMLVPAIPASDQLTGFPFQNETLRYNVNWPSSLSLGEVVLTATKREGGGWNFESNLSVGVPGFPIADKYRSSIINEYCSIELHRELSRGTKKNTEKTTFDQKGGHASRQTLFPLGGGKTEIDFSGCGRDALAALYFARKELGQGRMPPAGTVFFGGPYQVKMEYTGAMNIMSGGRSTVTDHVNVSVKGPVVNSTFEMFFARDAARTPLLVKVPVAVGTLSLELAR
jgi:hypothetical protein